MKQGDRINERYEVLGELGHGGSAEIFLARDLELQREVAVKVITTGEGNLPLPDLHDEAHLLAQLHHPGIVTVFDCGNHDGAFYLVMEHVSGRTLTEILEEREFDARDVVKLAGLIAEAMIYSHDKGVVHRDLTLTNIMVTESGDGGCAPKILDYGLGRNEGNGRDFLAEYQAGTASFMPPEQIQGGATDERSDIYSFGICLYRLLTGDFPFESTHLAALEYKVCNEPPPPVDDDLPEELAQLVERCLEKDPERRPLGFREIGMMLKSVTVTTNRAPGADVHSCEQSTRLGNPYLSRVMIQDMKDFFGRRREIRKIFARLDAFPPQSISIVGDRRIGKSSLLNFLYQPNNRRRFMQNAADAVFVFLDFQSDIDFTAERFLQLMMMGLPAACVGRTAAATPTFQDLEQAVSRVDEQGKRLIVLMDEFEKITGNANFERGFFSFLRHLANHYKVAYVTSSEAELMTMCHDRVISDSPFFNIFSNLPLGSFTREEARELVTRPSEEAGCPLEAYVEQLLECGGRIPMYLQIVCSCYFEEAMVEPDRELTWESVRQECMRELQPHFLFTWDKMPDVEKSILTTLAGGGRIPPQQKHIGEDLRRRGLLILEDGREQVFSRAFREFIDEYGAGRKGLLGRLFGKKKK